MKKVYVGLDGLTFNARVWQRGDVVPLAKLPAPLKALVTKGEHPHLGFKAVKPTVHEPSKASGSIRLRRLGVNVDLGPMADLEPAAEPEPEPEPE